jgi:hypothetical protein
MNGSPGDRRTTTRAAALILGAAIVALLLGNGPALWERAAYREPTRELGFEMSRKRWDWLPGPELRIPDQPCPSCQMGEHISCARHSGTIRLASNGPAGTSSAVLTVYSGVTLRMSKEPFGVIAESRAIAINDVIVTPATFRCPCCPAD